jgi:hypothetical protein
MAAFKQRRDELNAMLKKQEMKLANQGNNKTAS